MNLKKEIIILTGVPYSGQEDWIRNFRLGCSLSLKTIGILSRDMIRLKHFGMNYIINPEGEKKVTNLLNVEFDRMLVVFDVVILDSNHCSEFILDRIITLHEEHCKISIIFFDKPLYKIYINRLVNYWDGYNWLTFKLLKRYFNNYKRINKEKYKKYIIK